MSGNVRSDPRDDVCASMLQEFAPDPRLGFAEAVAQESVAGGFLLPHRHPDVVGVKLIAGVMWFWAAAFVVLYGLGLFARSAWPVLEPYADTLLLAALGLACFINFGRNRTLYCCS